MQRGSDGLWRTVGGIAVSARQQRELDNGPEESEWTTFWVGLETNDFPNGLGEDHREYVTVAKGADPSNAIQGAVLRLASTLTNLSDGDRIAIHLVR